MHDTSLINMEVLESILSDYLNDCDITEELKARIVRDICSQITITAFDIIRYYTSEAEETIPPEKKIMDHVFVKLTHGIEELFRLKDV